MYQASSDKSDAAPVLTLGLVERNWNHYFFEYHRRLAVVFLSDPTMSSDTLGDVSPLPAEVITTVVVICLVILIIMCSYISWTLFTRTARFSRILKMVKMRKCTRGLALQQCQREALLGRKSFSRLTQYTNFPLKAIQPKWMLQTDRQSSPLGCKLTNDHSLSKSKEHCDLGNQESSRCIAATKEKRRCELPCARVNKSSSERSVAALTAFLRLINELGWRRK